MTVVTKIVSFTPINSVEPNQTVDIGSAIIRNLGEPGNVIVQLIDHETNTLVARDYVYLNSNESAEVLMSVNMQDQPITFALQVGYAQTKTSSISAYGELVIKK